MHWILIIISYADNFVTTVEFNTQQACETAQVKVVATDHDIKAICTPKG